jgi:rare lipoprotein A (peptidoglycan hydrolase)
MWMKFLIPLAFAIALPLNAQIICDGQSDATVADPLAPKLLKLDPAVVRTIRYMAVESSHKLTGLASYYSTSLNGTLTANGERYWNKRLSAAHLTLPLGCWVEVRSVATGKKICLRVNDRGPYVKKFVIDLSQAAARAIGVDVAEDRTVLVRIIAMPGEQPMLEEAVTAVASAAK